MRIFPGPKSRIRQEPSVYSKDNETYFFFVKENRFIKEILQLYNPTNIII